jgi:phosphoribosylaminoimidazolecarboxamide formyltransferase/IMP cyclohydrolase
MTSMESVPVRRALISVSDKTGVVEFAQGLAALGIEIVSTGGTASALRDAGLPVTSVSDVTGFPEILEGRVKTLHPAIHAALLADLHLENHRATLDHSGFTPIGLVAVNLYPFGAIADAAQTDGDAIEGIDIGGVALLRAGAKNYANVAAVSDPADYDRTLADLRHNEGRVTVALREELAAKAFAHTAAYDAAIADWFTKRTASLTPSEDAFPTQWTLSGTLRQTLRYGENPHQSAALYATEPARPGIVTGKQLQGKELSYNNIADADAAFALISEFRSGKPAVVIMKHANPCGAAVGHTLREAYDAAFACDPVSAFGGIIAVNRALDGETADAILGIFSEVVIAPRIAEEARALFARKPNVRLIETGELEADAEPPFAVRSIAGGFLVQSPDDVSAAETDLRVVTKNKPAQNQIDDLLFAMKVAKHVKSNAIVFAKDGATVGIGAGQMSRVDSVRIAVMKAETATAYAKEHGQVPRTLLDGSVVASDAFFPFPDGVIAAAKAGATAIIQPGGSVRDADVIAAADEAGVAMVFTGTRHFRH